jgi:hypothetical protein
MKVKGIDFYGFQKFHNFLVEKFLDLSVTYVSEMGIISIVVTSKRGMSNKDNQEVCLWVFHPAGELNDKSKIEGGLSFVEKDEFYVSFSSSNTELLESKIKFSSFDDDSFVDAIQLVIGKMIPVSESLSQDEYNSKVNSWFDWLCKESGLDKHLVPYSEEKEG